MIKKLLLLVVVFVLALFAGSFGREYRDNKAADSSLGSSALPQPVSTIPSPATSPTTSTTTPETTEPNPNIQKPTTVPAKFLITVPFTVQAPHANWDELHDEACEEASLIMLKHFTDGTSFGSADAADKEITEMVAYETEQGFKYDVTVQELATIAKHYGLTKGRVETTISVQKIKQEIAAGRPVIVPLAGREIGNPHFRSPGPVYHMLVIKGYDNEGFITNDPGTKFGENYRYGFDKLFNAIHNWNATDITKGAPVYLVFD